MEERSLFIDGSVAAKSKIGFGAFLIIDAITPTTDYLSAIRVKRFENTSSTKLELQTLLWALDELESVVDSLIIYTDSQNIVSLPGRRERLENAQFRSKNGNPLNNEKLYQEFYKTMDTRDVRMEKVKGHQARTKKGPVESIFTQVDRAARAALRDFRASKI